MRAALLLASLGAAHAELIADEFTSYSGYSVSGVVGPITTTVKSHATYQTYSYSLSGVDPLCSSVPGTATDSCAIIFYTGRDCSATGSHYYSTGGTDPYTRPYNIFYTASTTRTASAASVTVPTNIPENDMHGKTVVVHAYDGTKMGCSIMYNPIFLQRLLAIPRVSKANCRNILRISQGLDKAVPIDVSGTDHQKAGTLRSIPPLNKLNCEAAYPNPYPAQPHPYPYH